MRLALGSACIGLAVTLSGCANDAHEADLASPASGEHVTISVKVPENLLAESVQVIYRSKKCPVRRYGAGWSTYEVEGYLTDTVDFQKQSQTDLFQVKLSLSRDTGCQWKLSNATFGVTYANTAQLGENVEVGPGGGVIVMFDQHLPQRRSVFQPTIKVEGDAVIRKDYYPWVSERFWDGHRKIARILGEGEIYSYYRAPNARSVIFEPIFHAGYALYSVAPKVQKDGEYRRFIYPDGSVTATGYGPSFKKLQTIRLTAESKK